MTFQQRYPEAYKDECGTVWVNKAAADAGKIEFDSNYANGDAFLDDVLGWSMADALENFTEAQKIVKSRSFWAAHPWLLAFCRFVRKRYGFTSLFLRIVWRDWYGLISWAVAWKMAGDLWLR